MTPDELAIIKELHAKVSEMCKLIRTEAVDRKKLEERVFAIETELRSQ